MYCFYIPAQRPRTRKNNEESEWPGINEGCCFLTRVLHCKGRDASYSNDKVSPIEDRSSFPPPGGCDMKSACPSGISDQQEEALGRQEGVCVPFSWLLGRAAAQCPVERADAKRWELSRGDPTSPRASPRTPPVSPCNRLCTFSSPHNACCWKPYRWAHRS